MNWRDSEGELDVSSHSKPGFLLWQDSVDYGPWAESGLMPICVNKVLLKHSHICLLIARGYFCNIARVE